jgi:EAL domain-containing protein (putative c-di-GMP-specific phosphodiesterase class I)
MRPRPHGQELTNESTEVGAVPSDYPNVRPLSIAVNISGRQLEDEDFSGFVSEVLTESRLSPSSLVLELTETALVDETGTGRCRPRPAARARRPPRHR